MKSPFLKAFTATVVVTAAFGSRDASAQATATGTTTLNVAVSQSRSITINNATVTLNMNTPAHFTGGNNVTMANHVSVVSSGGYKITVNAPTNLTNGANTLASNLFTVTATAGTPAVAGTPTLAAQPLQAATPAALVSSTVGTTSGGFNIKYSNTGGSSFLGLTDGTYSGTVTYTIAAP